MRLKFINQIDYKGRARRRFRIVTKTGGLIGIPEAQGKLLMALMFRPFLSLDEAVEVLWPDPDDQAEMWMVCIRVHMHGIRKILSREGIQITFMPRQGYRLTPNID